MFIVLLMVCSFFFEVGNEIDANAFDCGLACDAGTISRRVGSPHLFFTSFADRLKTINENRIAQELFFTFLIELLKLL